VGSTEDQEWEFNNVRKRGTNEKLVHEKENLVIKTRGKKLTVAKRMITQRGCTAHLLKEVVASNGEEEQTNQERGRPLDCCEEEKNPRPAGKNWGRGHQDIQRAENILRENKLSARPSWKIHGKRKKENMLRQRWSRKGAKQRTKPSKSPHNSAEATPERGTRAKAEKREDQKTALEEERAKVRESSKETAQKINPGETFCGT